MATFIGLIMNSKCQQTLNIYKFFLINVPMGILIKKQTNYDASILCLKKSV